MSDSGRETFAVGNCGHVVEIDRTWRVLDVGSGQSPHPRADVLLEQYPDDNRHRAGDPIPAGDPRLVIGDALAMPFPDGSFDFAIASHVVEHVDDPVRVCAELARVARRGYIETPGWLGDLLLREEFHPWRVYRRGAGLEFRRVTRPRPAGILGDVFYALVYAGVRREGHWTLMSSRRPLRALVTLIGRVFAKLIRSRPLRASMYLTFDWDGPFPVLVRDH